MKTLNLLFFFFCLNGLLISQSESCINFDGGDDRISIPVEVDQALGTYDFTFEATINGLESNNSTATILSNRTSTNSGFQFFIHNYWGGSDHQMLSLRYNEKNWVFIDNGDFNGKVLDGDCHHVAVTKLGGTLSFYIDGILIGTRQNQPNIDLSTSSPLFIGSDPTSNNAFNGLINDVRIWNKARTIEELQNGFNNGVSLSSPGLLGSWEMKGGAGQTISDQTGQFDAHLGSELFIDSNDPTWGNTCCDGGSSGASNCLSFDGSDDYVSIPVEVIESLGSNDFTFEAVVNGEESDIGSGTILSNRTSTNSGFQLFVHNYWGGSDHKMLSLRYNETNWLFINNGDYGGKFLDGTCHHVAVSKTGGTISFYIDGILIGIRQNQPDNVISTNTPIIIGNDPISSNAFNGNINDVRIWNTGRSQSEIQDGIDNGVDASTSGLLGHWKIDEGTGQSIVDQTSQNDAVLGSSSDVESNDPIWGEGCCESTPIDDNCLSFESIADRVTIPEEVGQELGAGDFTLEAQISGQEGDIGSGTILSNRISPNEGLQLFIHTYWGGSDHKMLSLRYNGTNWLFIDNGDFNGKLLDGECHQVAVSKLDGTISFYIDGILIGKRENQPDIDINTDTPFLIGNDRTSADAFDGVINDVRIWNVGKTAGEIQDAIDNGVDPNASNLLGYWQMREGEGQIAYDLTNKYDAMIGAESGADVGDPIWGGECCGEGIDTDVKDVQEFGNNISVFPNPTNGQFTIEFKNAFIPNKYNYTLIDNIGRTLATKKLSKQNIDLSNISSGQYFLKISNDQEVLDISKLVIIK